MHASCMISWGHYHAPVYSSERVSRTLWWFLPRYLMDVSEHSLLPCVCNPVHVLACRFRLLDLLFLRGTILGTTLTACHCT